MNKTARLGTGLLLLMTAVGLAVPVSAARTSASESAATVQADTPVKEADTASKKIEDLKERLATKVAELSQSEKMAVTGMIKSLSVASLTVETSTKDYKIELTDDIRVIQYIKSKRTVLTTDDLAKGDTVVVFGVYDPTLDVLKAQSILIQDDQPEVRYGTAVDVNRKEYSITIKTPLNEEYTVDYESFTKTTAWTPDKKTEKSGFSRLRSGDLLFITGYPVPKSDFRISALRILDMGGAESAASPSAAAVSPKPSLPVRKLSPTVAETPATGE